VVIVCVVTAGVLTVGVVTVGVATVGVVTLTVEPPALAVAVPPPSDADAETTAVVPPGVVTVAAPPALGESAPAVTPAETEAPPGRLAVTEPRPPDAEPPPVTPTEVSPTATVVDTVVVLAGGLVPPPAETPRPPADAEDEPSPDEPSPGPGPAGTVGVVAAGGAVRGAAVAGSGARGVTTTGTAALGSCTVGITVAWLLPGRLAGRSGLDAGRGGIVVWWTTAGKDGVPVAEWTGERDVLAGCFGERACVPPGSSAATPRSTIPGRGISQPLSATSGRGTNTRAISRAHSRLPRRPTTFANPTLDWTCITDPPWSNAGSTPAPVKCCQRAPYQ